MCVLTVLLSSLFFVKHLSSPCCTQHSVLRVCRGEHCALRGKDSPEGEPDKAEIPRQGDEGCGLSDEAAWGRGTCLSLGVHRKVP